MHASADAGGGLAKQTRCPKLAKRELRHRIWEVGVLSREGRGSVNSSAHRLVSICCSPAANMSDSVAMPGPASGTMALADGRSKCASAGQQALLPCLHIPNVDLNQDGTAQGSVLLRRHELRSIPACEACVGSARRPGRTPSVVCSTAAKLLS